MMVEVLGKQYEVIEILPKKYPEHDLFICKSKLGYKECFQRFDIGRELKKVNMSEAVNWTYKEIEIVKEAIRKGIKYTDISKLEGLERHTENAIRSRYIRVRRDLLWKEEAEREKKKGPRFNVKF